ncbi:MAG: LysR family transcriptional regulator [Eubacteriales bacterium]|nr:LysR family transcriptional regulator [Eubacteriales bacterium]
MDITQLQYFRTIAETGSLTKAAKRLHISQPAMSAMLKKFEEELQVELFDRSPNRIHLNPVGEIALVHVNTILRNIEQMKADLLSAAEQNLTLSIAFCDPGVRWYCVPRFSLAHPEIQVKDELYTGGEAKRLLTERVYDLIVTPKPVQGNHIQSLSFLPDQVYLSVSTDSKLLGRESISLREIPAQPLLYPQIGGYFLMQMEKIITEDNLPITLIKNNYNTTQYMIRTTNFLATIGTLSMDLRNDGTHRTLIPMSDPELNVVFHISFLKSNREKVQKFLDWGKECLGQRLSASASLEQQPLSSEGKTSPDTYVQ